MRRILLGEKKLRRKKRASIPGIASWKKTNPLGLGYREVESDTV